MRGSRRLALAHGLFYVITGLWPLLHLRSFMAVTGPKTDRWLVNTVGVMVAVVGGVLTRAGLRHGPTVQEALLAVGCAVGLSAIDAIYVMRRVIRPIYLLDALAELVLVGGWLRCWHRGALRDP